MTFNLAWYFVDHVKYSDFRNKKMKIFLDVLLTIMLMMAIMISLEICIITMTVVTSTK